MAMDDCMRCGTKITSLGDAWAHLDDDHDDHEARPAPATIRTPVRREDAPRLDI